LFLFLFLLLLFFFFFRFLLFFFFFPSKVSKEYPDIHKNKSVFWGVFFWECFSIVLMVKLAGWLVGWLVDVYIRNSM